MATDMKDDTTIGGGIIEAHSLQDSLGEYKGKGFILSEEADHILVLYHWGVEILRVTQTSVFATKEFIQNECKTRLILDGGISYQKKA